jgi:hypothetical protein
MAAIGLPAEELLHLLSCQSSVSISRRSAPPSPLRLMPCADPAADGALHALRASLGAFVDVFERLPSASACAGRGIQIASS